MSVALESQVEAAVCFSYCEISGFQHFVATYYKYYRFLNLLI